MCSILPLEYIFSIFSIYNNSGRRVGKTFLVLYVFKNKSDGIFFNVTGIKDGLLSEQLKVFTLALAKAFDIPASGLKIQENWHDAVSSSQIM
jgi:hypothetical protein